MQRKVASPFRKDKGEKKFSGAQTEVNKEYIRFSMKWSCSSSHPMGQDGSRIPFPIISMKTVERGKKRIRKRIRRRM